MTNPIRVLLIPVDGPIRFEMSQPGLTAMQAHVQGDTSREAFIESVGRRSDATAYANEDGKAFHAPNLRANQFLTDHFGHFGRDTVRGPIVVLGVTDDGEDTDLPEDLVWAAATLWELEA